MSNTDNFSPYCPICEGCGEDGCCSPFSCKQHPEGSYCKTYLKDLKFGYLLSKELFNLISDSNNPELIKSMDEIYDNVYDKIYK